MGTGRPAFKSRRSCVGYYLHLAGSLCCPHTWQCAMKITLLSSLERIGEGIPSLTLSLELLPTDVRYVQSQWETLDTYRASYDLHSDLRADYSIYRHIHGNFIRIFNVHLEPGVDGQPGLDKLPNDSQPMPRGDISILQDNTPIFRSRSVSVRSLSANASG